MLFPLHHTFLLTTLMQDEQYIKSSLIYQPDYCYTLPQGGNRLSLLVSNYLLKLIFNLHDYVLTRVWNE